MITQWSPAVSIAAMSALVAAMPVPKQAAAWPPSSSATLRSRAVTVGLLLRAYE